MIILLTQQYLYTSNFFYISVSSQSPTLQPLVILTTPLSRTDVPLPLSRQRSSKCLHVQMTGLEVHYSCSSSLSYHAFKPKITGTFPCYAPMPNNTPTTPTSGQRYTVSKFPCLPLSELSLFCMVRQPITCFVSTQKHKDAARCTRCLPVPSRLTALPSDHVTPFPRGELVIRCTIHTLS